MIRERLRQCPERVVVSVHVDALLGTLAWASRERLTEAAAFVADVVRSLQDKTGNWTRPAHGS